MSSTKLSACLQLLLSCNACLLFSQETPQSVPIAPLYDLSVSDGGGDPNVRVVFSQNGRMFACHKSTFKLGFMSAASTHSELGVFDVESGSKILTIPDGWKGFAFSPDNEHFVSWDFKEVTVWNLNQPEAVKQLAIANVRGVTYVKDGKWFMTQTNAAEDSPWVNNPFTVRFWDAITLKQISTPIDQRGPWYDPVVTLDGELFVGFEESDCVVLEVATGDVHPSPKNVTPAGMYMYPTCLSADGKHVVLHSDGGKSLMYWDFTTSQSQKLGATFESRFEANSLLSGQLHRFAMGGMAGMETSFYVDNIDSRWIVKDVFNDKIVKDFPDNTKWQRSDDGFVRILPTNRMLLSQHPRRISEIRCFDLKDGEQFTLLRTDQNISGMSLSLDGNKLAVDQTTYSKSEPQSDLISVWDLPNQRKMFETELFTREQFYIPVSFLNFSPDSRLVIGATNSKSGKPEVFTLDGTTGSKLVMQSNNLPPSKIYAVSSDGKLIACSIPNEIHILDSVDFTLKQKLVFSNLPSAGSGYSTPQLGTVHQVAFSSNGKKLVASSYYNGDQQMSYWNLEDGKLEALRRSGPYSFLEFVENEDAIRCITFDNQVMSLFRIDQLSGLSVPGVESVLTERATNQVFDLTESLGSVFYAGEFPKNQITICHTLERNRKFVSRVFQCSSDSGKLIRMTNLNNYIVEGAIVAERSNYLIVRGTDIPPQTAYIVDTTSGEVISSFQNSSINASSPDGKYVLINDLVANGEVRLCDSETGVELGRIKGPGLVSGRGFFSPDGGHFGISHGVYLSVWSIDQFDEKTR